MVGSGTLRCAAGWSLRPDPPPRTAERVSGSKHRPGRSWTGRVEDDPLLRGLGRYTADHGDGALVARFVRSNIAHADIESLDLSSARGLDGVVAAYGMADLAEILPMQPAALDTIKNRDGSTTPVPSRPALAHDRVRFVGEAFALVVARTDSVAADAAEAVLAEFTERPASSRLEPDAEAVSVHDLCPDDLGFDWLGGDEAATASAFEAAACVARVTLRVPRILGAPLEPFACLASFDAETDAWILVTPSQGSHAIRRELADGYLGVPHDRLRVVTPDVGGAFGIRIHSLPEQAALLGAARLLGRTIVWRADRTESNLCEPHARDFLVDAELALDAGGGFLAVRADARCNLGAYVHPGARATPTVSLLFGLQGAYRMPALSLRMRGLYTNTTPTGPFRGAGQPEGTYVLERLIDRAAGLLGLSPTELRRRNAIGFADGARKAATGHLVESCDAAGPLGLATAWLARGPSCADGRREGRGLALYLKVNGMGRQERAEVAVDAETGDVTAFIGSQTNGQGHTTTFAALAAERLGLDPANLRVVQGDTALVTFGTGTGASSALGTTGTGVSRSCTDLLAKARDAAASHLGVPAERLDYEAGSFRLPGTNLFVTLQQLAAELPGGLVGRSEIGVSLTYTVGCHACRVAIDEQTGEVDVIDYAAFDDLGPVLQPEIAGGQIHGGVAQGIGQALQESVCFDADAAQPVTATFLDYRLPRAADLPDFDGAILETPDGGTDLGIRGAGEAGAIASMAAVVNAVDDALGGGRDLEAPLTPQRVWRYLQQSSPGAARDHLLQHGDVTVSDIPE